MTALEKILSLINSIPYPLLNLKAEEMGLNPHWDEQNNQVSLQLLAGFPTRPLEKEYLPALTRALKQTWPSIDLPLSIDFSIQAHQGQLPGKRLAGVKNVIAIGSGKGGVGKSTVSVNLAIALAKAGARVGLLDADIYGPSIPLMLGPHQGVEVRDERYIPVRAQGIDAMSIGYLMDVDQALIWRGPMLAKSLIQMIDTTLWDNLDYLLIDLPPGTGDIPLSLVQKIPLSGAVVVTTPQNIATLDAGKAIAMFEKTGIPVLGLVENMSQHICGQCGHQESIFGQGGGEQLATTYQVPLLGQLPLDSRIQSNCDQGKPEGIHFEAQLAEAFLKIALKMAIGLSKRPKNYADKFPPIVVE